MGKTLSSHENPLDFLSEIHCQGCLLLHSSGAAMPDASAWILVFTGIQSQNHYDRQVIIEPVLPSDISVFHMQVEHVNHKKKNVFEKISILQSVILNVSFLLQLFNSASFTFCISHQGDS